MPRIIVSKVDGLTLLDVELDSRRAYSVGRSSAATIRLDAPSISRLHAVLIPRGGRWIISDLGSKRGLRCERGHVDATPLSHGDWVALGSAYLWYEDEHAPQDDQINAWIEAKREESEKNKFALLIGGTSQKHPRIVALNDHRPITIGTSSSCDVEIDEASNEPVQLGIFPHRSGWRVTSMTASKLLDHTGLNARSAPLEPKTTVFAGALSLSVIPIESQAMPVTRPSNASNELIEDPSMMPSLDLEQVARSGRRSRPERPNAA